jgi:hypothetical protein
VYTHKKDDGWRIIEEGGGGASENAGVKKDWEWGGVVASKF